MQSVSYAAIQGQHSPAMPKYQPGQETPPHPHPRQRTNSDPPAFLGDGQPHLRHSTGSLNNAGKSLSLPRGVMAHMTDSQRRRTSLDHLNPTKPSHPDYVQRGVVVYPGSNPPTPQRGSSSSKMMSLPPGGASTGSIESISRSSDASSVRHSRENLVPHSAQEVHRTSNESLVRRRGSQDNVPTKNSDLYYVREKLQKSREHFILGIREDQPLPRTGVMSKSVTTGQLPSANYRPVPYSRSHTTSALPAAPTMATVAEYPPATSQPYLIPRVMDPRPVLQKYGDAPTPYTTIASHHLAKGGNGGKSYEVRSYTDSYEGDSSSSQTRDAYPHREKVDGSKQDDSYENDPPYIRPRPPRFYIDAPRPYTSHNHRITSKVSSDGRNLGAGMIVSHRKKLFDEGKKSKEELAAEITKDYLKEIENYTSDTRYESFAMRLAVFEKKDGDFVPGSLEKRPSLSSSSGSLDRNLSLVEGGQGAADFEEVPNSLSVYFRPRGELEGGATEPSSTHLLLPGGAVTAPPISMQRRGSSPGRDPPPYSRQFSDTDASSDASHSPLIERDRSPLMSIDENQEVRLRQKTARKALRQPSYLNAIDAPKSIGKILFCLLSFSLR